MAFFFWFDLKNPIICAIKNEENYDENSVFNLLETDNQFESKSGDYLVTACCYRRMPIIKYLLDIGVDIHYNGDQPLRAAFSNGDIKMVAYLLQRGANIHANKENALTQAVKQGNVEMVQFLIDHGATVNDLVIRYAHHYKRLEMLPLLQGNVERASPP